MDKKFTRQTSLNLAYKEAVELFKNERSEYIPILQNINVIWDHPDIEVAGISPNGLYLNGEWVLKHLAEELAFVLLHECLHVVLAHRERLGERNHLIWNIANDLVINEGIKAGLYVIPYPEPLKMPKYEIEFSNVFETIEDFQEFCIKFGLRVSEDIAIDQVVSESVYDYLLEKQEKLKKEIFERKIDIIQEEKQTGLRPFEEEKQEKIDAAIVAILGDLEKKNNKEGITSKLSNPRSRGGGNCENSYIKFDLDLKENELPKWLKEIQVEVKRKGIDRKTSSFQD